MAALPKRQALPIDYSPDEVVRMDLLGIGRSAVYKWIRDGKIRVTYNANGNTRIPAAEIDRLRHVEQPIDGIVRLQAIRREKLRAAGLMAAAKHTPAEMIAPMLDGQRRKAIRAVDPDGTCTPQELERRLDLYRKAEMARVRAAKLEHQARRAAATAPP